MRSILALISITLATVLVAPPFAQAQDVPGLILAWGSAGTGPAQFNAPAGLGIGPDGHVYVADLNNHCVQEFLSDGTFVRQFGSPGHAAGELSSPKDVAVGPAGIVYVADAGNARISRFDASGAPLPAWPVDAGMAPGSIALSPDGRRVYARLENSLECAVAEFDSSGARLRGLPLDGPFAGSRQFNVGPTGEIWVPTGGNCSVWAIDSSLAFAGSWSAPPGSAPGQCNYLSTVAQGTDGFLYVGSYDHRIQKFTSTGQFVAEWGISTLAWDIAVDASNNLYAIDYVVDLGTFRILKYAYTNTPTTHSSWGRLKTRFR